MWQSSSGAPVRSSTARAPAVCTRARSRCSISAASPIGSSRRGRRGRARGLPGAGWVDELGVPIARQREVTGFAQDDTGVDVDLSDGRSLRADYLVGCDGGRSVIRKAAGIEFAGWDPSTSWLMAEVEMVEKPEFGLRPGGGIGPAGGGDRIRLGPDRGPV